MVPRNSEGGNEEDAGLNVRKYGERYLILTYQGTWKACLVQGIHTSTRESESA